MRTSALGAVLAAAGLAASACSSASSTKAVPPTSMSAPSTTTAASHGSGPVDVLYAGSLVDLMNDDIGPAFRAATGYTLDGTSGDSGTLANEIKGKAIVGDVFISANPSKDQTLEGPANGNWVSWYATFATSPLVLGYNTDSKFARELKSDPWYRSINESGLLLGRTDPTTDPKGALTVTALDDAATTYNEPALAADAKNSSEVFPENTLVGRLQSGQLDAGFFYSVEATAADIPFVPVSGVGVPGLQASYTITILARAPHMAAAEAFVGYLLGYNGVHLLTKAGVDPENPIPVSGTAPADVRGILSGG